MPKILYLVAEDWFFVSHFLPMARAALATGLEVVVATNIRAHGERIRAEGFRAVALDIDRRSLNLFEGFNNLRSSFAVVKSERPDIVHCIALRSVVLGGVAAHMAGARRLVLAPTGLGHLWLEGGAFVRFARGFARLVVGRWLRRAGTQYLFENRDDPCEFGLDPDGPNVTIVGGSGVDPADFPFVSEPPAPPVKVAVVARMIAPKGIAEAVAATRRARALGAAVELDLFGDSDPSDRRGITEATLRQWSTELGIKWHGPTADVAKVWREHHVAMLLSHREGAPRSLIEAAAAGRPIIATDTVGCREIVRDGHEGVLVPVGDSEAAAQALVKLAADARLRIRLGAAANARFRERLSEDAVKQTVGMMYRRLLNFPK